MPRAGSDVWAFHFVFLGLGLTDGEKEREKEHKGGHDEQAGERVERGVGAEVVKERFHGRERLNLRAICSAGE